MLSGPRAVALALHRELHSYLEQSDIAELKWHKVRTARYRQTAIDVVDRLLPHVADRTIRIDVLSWDSKDSRHSVKDPDLEANLQVMYYHLFKNVMSHRWPSDCVWRHIPDEQSCIDWDNLHDFLAYADSKTDVILPLSGSPEQGEIILRLRQLFSVHKITPRRSHDMCLTQVADVFAGLCAFSREHSSEFKNWTQSEGYGADLFTDANKSKHSAGVREKLRVLSHLRTRASSMGLSIFDSTVHALRTRNPRTAMNFWWYEPKSTKDKARSKADLH